MKIKDIPMGVTFIRKAKVDNPNSGAVYIRMKTEKGVLITGIVPGVAVNSFRKNQIGIYESMSCFYENVEHEIVEYINITI